ncbi:MAG: 50S ribosomal protein L29 [Candidatus Pacebacteria bacterium]|nr:50S ribosomal protein L29 [Candidatus Paceibacterota bacterium]
MKLKDWELLKNKTEAELSDSLKKDKERLWSLLVDLKAGKSNNIKEIRSLKKTIARINTLINNKLK